MLPWSETPHVKRRSLRFDTRRVLSKQVRSQTVIEVVKSRAFQIVCTWGLHWPWKSTTQQNNHQQTVSANMAPRNNINKKQTKRYRLSVGDKSTGSAGTVQGSLHVFFFFLFWRCWMCYSLWHTEPNTFLKRVYITGKKANTSVIYMDAVLSMIRSKTYGCSVPAKGKACLS